MISRRGFWPGWFAFFAGLAKSARADVTAGPGPPIQVRITPSKVATVTFNDVQRETIDGILQDIFSKREHGTEVLQVLQEAHAITLVLISNKESKRNLNIQ